TRSAARLLLLHRRRPRTPDGRGTRDPRRRVRVRAGQQHLDAGLGRHDPARWARTGVLGSARGRLDSRSLPSRGERGHGVTCRLREAESRDGLGAERVVGGRRCTDDRVVCGEPTALDRPRRLAHANPGTGVKTLVTGGGGFLGSHLVARLEADGHDVVVPRRAEVDLTHWDEAERLFRDTEPERVFHLAGEVGGIGANRLNPGRFWYANLMMGAHVLELSREHGVGKLVIAGTVCAYPKFAPCRFARPTCGTAIPKRRTRPTASPRSRSSSARRPIASSTASTRSSCYRRTSTDRVTIS